MKIILATSGLPFGPRTLDYYSLGGSETAVLQMAEELQKRGHQVTLFCEDPKPPRKDCFQMGETSPSGVQFFPISQYPHMSAYLNPDVLIVARHIEIFLVPHQAQRTILWFHDLAEEKHLTAALKEIGYRLSEIWALSEFHRDQIHKVTQYPKNRIRITRNGIVDFRLREPHQTSRQEGGHQRRFASDFAAEAVVAAAAAPAASPVAAAAAAPAETATLVPPPTLPQQQPRALSRTLLYASRPERGMAHLVKPGGIMSYLPEFKLQICMYDHFPESMKEIYMQLTRWSQNSSNVQILGVKTQLELRRLMKESFAYIYPTSFEETSCVLARECMEQQLPVIYSPVGALSETLKDCGWPVPFKLDHSQEADELAYQAFAKTVRELFEDPNKYKEFQDRMAQRCDLYWSGVADQWDAWLNEPLPMLEFSQLRSMMENSDVIPILHNSYQSSHDTHPLVKKWYLEVQKNYSFLESDRQAARHYDLSHEEEIKKNGLPFSFIRGNPRYEAIKTVISQLPSGARILDYGCGEGNVLLNLALEFPDKLFYGVDFSEVQVHLAKTRKEVLGIQNIHSICVGSIDRWPQQWVRSEELPFDLTMANEVLEHVKEPWTLLDQLERRTRYLGTLVLTVPTGPWEMQSLRRSAQDWARRHHIWHLDDSALVEMLSEKKEKRIHKVILQMPPDDFPLGNIICTYQVDHKKTHPLLSQKKIYYRPTLGALIWSERTEDHTPLMRLLNSIHLQTALVQIYSSPKKSLSKEINRWIEEHPWVLVQTKTLPEVFSDETEVIKYFSQERQSLQNVCDWFIHFKDTEVFTGNLKKYLRDHAYDQLVLRESVPFMSFQRRNSWFGPMGRVQRSKVRAIQTDTQSDLKKFLVPDVGVITGL